MSERLDAGLRALAERAEHTLVVDETWKAQARRRAGRGRMARGAAGAGALVALVVAGGFAASALSGAPAPLPPADGGSTAPTTPPATSEPAPSTSAPTSTLTVLDGWRDAGADPLTFAGSVVLDAVAWQGGLVAVGCDQAATVEGSTDPVDAPIWIGAGSDWRRSGPVTVPNPAGSGGAPVTCVYQVVATPWGLYATVGAGVIHSTDGLVWDAVTELTDLGAGWTVGAFAFGDRLTVLTQQASFAESEVATLWRTTDGTTWERLGTGPWPRAEAGVGDDPAVVFDNADVSDTVVVGDSLVAVGASPGGQFTPTAAAWTSTDTTTWTPATVEDGEGCYLTAVVAGPGGLVGAGWCSDTGQPALWSSADGTSWTRGDAPVADLPEYSFVQVTALTWLDDGTLALTGSQYVAADGSETPLQWLNDGTGWSSADDLAVPYRLVDGTGFWPPTGAGPSAVLVSNG